MDDKQIKELAKKAGFKFRSDQEGAGVWITAPHNGQMLFAHVQNELTAFAQAIASASQPERECCVPIPGEPSFVLLGRDPQAPDLIERWAVVRRYVEPDSDKPDKALAIAMKMRIFKKEHPDLGMSESLLPPIPKNQVL